MQLTDPSNPILYQQAAHIPTDTVSLKSMRAVAFDMFKLMICNNGVGIAAPQVGLSVRLMIVRGQSRGFRDAIVALNPTYEPSIRARKYTSTESCLTKPGQPFTVERFTHIEASWTDLRGHHHQIDMKGLPAAIFQHEMDHLNGVTIWQH